MVDNKELDSELAKCLRSVSSIKRKPIKSFTVDAMAIERLNFSVAKKLEQNKKERIASVLDAEDIVVGGKVLRK